MTISTKKATLLAAADTQQVLEDAIHAAHSFASQRWQADSQLLFQLAAQRLDANFPGRSACLGLAACPDLLADAVATVAEEKYDFTLNASRTIGNLRSEGNIAHDANADPIDIYVDAISAGAFASDTQQVAAWERNLFDFLVTENFRRYTIHRAPALLLKHAFSGD